MTLLSRYEAKSALIKLAITPGEPAGIGPDLCIQCYGNFSKNIQPVYFSDPDLLRERATLLGIKARLNRSMAREFVPGDLNFFPIPLKTSCEAGKLDAANAPYVLQTLKSALDLCQDETFQAMVTGPVNKAVINDAGIREVEGQPR